MPARARKEIVDSKVPGYYLVTQRVVRGLRLTGVDPETGRDYSYRQAKLERRIQELSGLYLIEIAEFNCGSDGFDLLVRTRPDLLPTLTDEEVVRRMLRRSEKQLELKPPPTPEAVLEVLSDPKRLAKLRSRIANLSQFMGDVDEAMARDVNRESGGERTDLALGRLWQGRFNSVRVLDAPALLLAATYVESKKVVDGEVAALDAAKCCSAALRGESTTCAPGSMGNDRDVMSADLSAIADGLPSASRSSESVESGESGESGESVESRHLSELSGLGDSSENRGPMRSLPASPAAWLLPMEEIRGECRRLIEGVVSRKDGPELSESVTSRECWEVGPYLGIAYDKFRRLLGWTLEQARAVRTGGDFKVDDELASLMARFRLRVDVWIEAVVNFRRWFRTAIGLGDALKSFARRLGVAWLAGQGRRRHPFTE